MWFTDSFNAVVCPLDSALSGSVFLAASYIYYSVTGQYSRSAMVDSATILKIVFYSVL